LKIYNEAFANKTTKDEKELEEDRKNMIIKGIQTKDTLSFDNINLKKRLIEKSFWMAESDKFRVEDLKKFSIDGNQQKPKKILICPADNQHRIKLKKIYELNFDENNNREFYCKACKKQLSFQKIAAIKNCGHCFCKKCLEEYCPLNIQKNEKKIGMCLCGKKFLNGDIIDLKEGHSSFSNHNKVEAEKYSPAFAI